MPNEVSHPHLHAHGLLATRRSRVQAPLGVLWDSPYPIFCPGGVVVTLLPSIFEIAIASGSIPGWGIPRCSSVGRAVDCSGGDFLQNKLSRESDDIPTVPGSNPGGEIL